MTQFVDKSQKIDLFTDAHCDYKSFLQEALMTHILRRNKPLPTRGGDFGHCAILLFVDPGTARGHYRTSAPFYMSSRQVE